MCVGDILEYLIERRLILLVDKSILEHPLALMSPQLDEVIVILETLKVGLRDALEYLRDIPEVIDVVRFGGSGKQLLTRLDLFVHFDGGADDTIPQIRDGLREWVGLSSSIIPLKHITKYSYQTIPFKRFDVQQLVVT